MDVSPAAAPASMTCGTRERSSPTLGSSGETPTPRCAARRVLYARKVKKSRPLVGANRATLAALPLKSARQPSVLATLPRFFARLPTLDAMVPACVRRRMVWRGAVAVREAAPPMAPARRCATGLLRPLDDVSRRGSGCAAVPLSARASRSSRGESHRAKRERASRVPVRDKPRDANGGARARRAEDAPPARSSARARGRRTRGIPGPGRRSRSRKTSSSVQDPLETSETIV